MAKKNNIIPFNEKVSLNCKYPMISEEAISKEHNLIPVNYRNSDIKQYPVLFFHRLMRENYGEPSKIWVEADEFKVVYERAIAAGCSKSTATEVSGYNPDLADELKTFEPRKVMITGDWAYYIKTPSGVIQVGTKHCHNFMQLSYVAPANVKEPDQKFTKEGEKFVDDLLKEASRLKGDLPDFMKEFEKQERDGIQRYLLTIDNVYLFNYGSAEMMLEHVEALESELQKEVCKYTDAEILNDEKKAAHTAKFALSVGMYFAACISYYFMSLEGFVNLIYYALLKKDFKQPDIRRRVEQLDLELKLISMPSLCDGFKSEYIDSNSIILKDFRKLKKYRNQIFHSNIEESLTNIGIFEDGFLYTINKSDRDSFPLQKVHLEKGYVLEVKRIVDELVKEILKRMRPKTCKVMTERLKGGSFVLYNLKGGKEDE